MPSNCDPDNFCNCDDCLQRRGYEVCTECGTATEDGHDDECSKEAPCHGTP